MSATEELAGKLEGVGLATWERPQLVRLWDWRERFVEWLVDAWDKSRRLSYGDADPEVQKYSFSWDPSKGHNCLTLASTSCLVITGVDLHDRFSPIPYTSEVEAYMAMRKLGFKSVDQLLESLFPEVEMDHTLTGDLCVVMTPDESGDGLVKACAICDPPFFWAMMPQGLGRGRLVDAKSFYAVARHQT